MLESPQLPDKLAEISTLTTILRGEKRKNALALSEPTKIKPSELKLDKSNRSDYTI